MCNIIRRGYREPPFPTSAVVTKKQDTRKDAMNSVTNNNLWLKYYLNICRCCKTTFINIHLVADKMRSYNLLAMAINYFYLFSEKNIKKDYCFLLTVQTNSLSSTDTVHANLSLSDKFNACTISTGTVVLNDFECEVCKLTVDSNSNNFIHSFLLFFINIYVNIL